MAAQGERRTPRWRRHPNRVNARVSNNAQIACHVRPQDGVTDFLQLVCMDCASGNWQCQCGVDHSEHQCPKCQVVQNVRSCLWSGFTRVHTNCMGDRWCMNSSMSMMSRYYSNGRSSKGLKLMYSNGRNELQMTP